MRYVVAAAAALAAFLAATPASATGGLTCRPGAGAFPALSLVIGHGMPGGVVGAHLDEGRRQLSTFREQDGLIVLRSWLDEDRVWVDLADGNAMTIVGQLRAAWSGSGRGRRLAGTFVRGGRLYRVSCEES
jgi:hypothetical protein